MKAVIMAGGSGTRFWPHSRHAKPKQLLPLFGETTMLEATVDRLIQTGMIDDLTIVTRRDLRDQIQNLFFKKNTRDISRIIVEPKKKNTAPCIGLSALYLLLEDPNSVMAIFPADHLIGDNDKFIESLKDAEKLAREHEGIVTIGISPTYPATGYGYINYGDEAHGMRAYVVRGFKEKPDHATAEQFFKSGNYLWNSGIFVWSVAKFFEELQFHMPKLYLSLMKIRERIVAGEEYDDLWNEIEDQSIDYGLMERVEKAYVVRGEFAWSDVGSWKAIYDLSKKNEDENVIYGDGIVIDGTRNLIRSQDGRLITLFGLSDVVVVSTDDAILVCAREKAEDVKKIIDILNKSSRNSFL